MSGPKHRTFPDRLFYVVRNFVEYGNYARDIKKAARIIHGHHPDIPSATCETEFRKYMGAYIDAVTFVDEHREYYHRQWDTETAGSAPKSKDELLFLKKHSGVPENTIMEMIYFIFAWHHLR
jgi:hypothetical protein